MTYKVRRLTNGGESRPVNYSIGAALIRYEHDRPRPIDIEAILNDLYASEINASISWVWDGGFYAVLGDPKLANHKMGLPTIRDAVLWLRDAACKHLPNSEFAQKYGSFV